jgi:hypothetical protein
LLINASTQLSLADRFSKLKALVNPLRLIVAIKGVHGEDARDKRLGTYGRWAFLELRASFPMRTEFDEWVENAVDKNRRMRHDAFRFTCRRFV